MESSLASQIGLGCHVSTKHSCYYNVNTVWETWLKTCKSKRFKGFSRTVHCMVLTVRCLSYLCWYETRMAGTRKPAAQIYAYLLRSNSHCVYCAPHHGKQVQDCSPANQVDATQHNPKESKHQHRAQDQGKLSQKWCEEIFTRCCRGWRKRPALAMALDPAQHGHSKFHVKWHRGRGRVRLGGTGNWPLLMPVSWQQKMGVSGPWWASPPLYQPRKSRSEDTADLGIRERPLSHWVPTCG